MARAYPDIECSTPATVRGIMDVVNNTASHLAAASATSRLPAAPTTVADANGRPRFGTYRGGLDAVDLSRLAAHVRPSPVRRILSHKKWLYTFIATPECVVLGAAVDLGYTSNAFVLAADLNERRVIVDRGALGLPRPLVHVSDRPGKGLRVRFAGAGAQVRAARGAADDRYRLSMRFGRPLRRPDLELDAALRLDGAPPPLTVIAPVDGGVVNVTQKSAGLASSGTLRVGERRFALDGGLAGVDYTNGYLARRTAWRWAFACGRLDDGTAVALNLVEGFNETRADVNENALWIGTSLVPLSRARFLWNKANPLDRWRVETVDGAVQLDFDPLGGHAEDRDLGLVKSHFVQPVGFFSGTIRAFGAARRVDRLAGVTEDQDILW